MQLVQQTPEQMLQQLVTAMLNDALINKCAQYHNPGAWVLAVVPAGGCVRAQDAAGHGLVARAATALWTSR
jgi:hypothetical protein